MKFQHRPALVLRLALTALVLGLCCQPAKASTTKPAAKRPLTHSTHAPTATHKAGVRTAHHKRASAKAGTAKAGSAGAHKTSVSARRGRGRKAKPRRSTAYTRLARMQMDPARVESIQQALTNAGAFHGTPTGQWDSATRDAMARYQSANGFGVTGLPDAKSLMKLGLGPHPLPPELNKTAAASGPDAAPDPSAVPSDKPTSDPAAPPVAPPSGDGPRR
jgi:hypothetical protein